MKFALLTLATVAATAAAFTVGPQHIVSIARGPSSQTNNAGSSITSSTLKMSEALEQQIAFAKGEIESNDVSFEGGRCRAIEAFSSWMKPMMRILRAHGGIVVARRLSEHGRI